MDNLVKEKRRIKIEKLKKQKEIMKEMGIKGIAVVDDEEVEAEALRKQKLDDAIKEHEEVDIQIHGLDENDDASLMEEKAAEDSQEESEDEDNAKAAPVEEKKVRKTRKKKAQDRK